MEEGFGWRLCLGLSYDAVIKDGWSSGPRFLRAGVREALRLRSRDYGLLGASFHAKTISNLDCV